MSIKKCKNIELIGIPSSLKSSRTMAARKLKGGKLAHQGGVNVFLGARMLCKN